MSPHRQGFDAKPPIINARGYHGAGVKVSFVVELARESAAHAQALSTSVARSSVGPTYVR